MGVTSCATGFAADEAGGCRAIQPPSACAKGEVAWLGETACHALVDCGTDEFGTPPADEPLLFVEAAADPTVADGSREHPYPTIGAAVKLVPRGTRTRIAIAEGTYDEQVYLDRAIDLWGRCPSKVNLAPTTGSNPYAILVNGAPSRIERLGISGAFGGVAALDSTEVVVADTWIHDTGDAGVTGQGDTKDGALLARHVLIERARDLGAYALGGTVTLESSIVRETRTAGGAVRGYGAAAEDKAKGRPSSIVVRASILERNHEAAVFAIGSTATVEGSLLRDTVVSDDAAFGVWVTASTLNKQASTLMVSDSVVEGMSQSAVYVVESTATLARTTIRHTQVTPKTKGGGQCVFSQRADLTMTDSSCLDARQIGLQIAGGRAHIDKTTVVGVRPDDLGHGGFALGSVPNVEAADLTVTDSAFGRLIDTGLFLGGCTATVTGVAVRDVTTTEGMEFGDGVAVVAFPFGDTWFSSQVSFDGLLVERVARAGVAAFADTTVSLRNARVSCADLPIVVSGFRGADSVPMGESPILEDGGGTLCGCGKQLSTCTASAASLTPVSLGP